MAEQQDPVTPSQDVQKPAKQDGQLAEEKLQGKTGDAAAVAATKKGLAHCSYLHSDGIPYFGGLEKDDTFRYARGHTGASSCCPSDFYKACKLIADV